MNEALITNSFEKGMNQDLNALDIPKGGYIRAQNAVNISAQGDLFSLTNEKGNLAVSSIPPGYSIIGYGIVNLEIILFLVSSTSSEIGVLNSSNQYTRILNSPELNFSLNHPIRCEARVIFNGNRVIYFTDNYNPMRRLNLDKLPTADLAKNIALFSEQKVPYLSSYSVQDGGGNLPSGAYQIIVRHLNDALAPGSFGLISDILPIVDDSATAPLNEFDGAPNNTPTGKALNLSISGIDTALKYVEIIAVYYSGTGGNPIANIIYRANIASNTLNVNYSNFNSTLGVVDIGQIGLEEVNYIRAKCVVQKDGRLFFSNLVAEEEPTDLQSIANGIEVYYSIEELEGRKYKEETNTTFKRSYRRNEVYSLSFGVIFKNGRKSAAYHIPAFHHGGAEQFYPANTATKRLGTYQSVTTYNAGLGLPDGRIRHHVTPDLAQEPHFTNEGKVRVLGLNFSNVVIPSTLKDKIVGYYVSRQLRNKENNKSVFAQGIVLPVAKYIDDTNEFPTRLSVSPFFGKTILGGIQYKEEIANEINVITAYGGFYSPDTILNETNLSNFASVEKVLDLKGDVEMTDVEEVGINNDDNYIIRAHFSLDLNEVYNQSVLAAVTLTDKRYLLPNRSITIGSDTFETYDSNGYLLLRCEEGFQYGSFVDYRIRITDGHAHLTSEGVEISAIIGATGKWEMGLYNLMNRKLSQYGNLEDAEYKIIGFTFNKDSTTLDGKVVYSGDTFIGKFSFVNAQKAKMGGNRGQGRGLQGTQLRSLITYYAESDLNVDYRHIYKNDATSQTEVPYYPKLSLISDTAQTNYGLKKGILDVDPGLGHNKGYNNNYSRENELQVIYSGNVPFVEQVTNFPTRTIYSEQSIEGEIGDAYSKFMTNNFQDIPKNKGEIVNSFVFNDKLYFHTPQALFEASVNNRTALASTTGEILLGNGGVLDRPPTEVFSDKGGYAGTLSQEAGVPTPFGYIFPDQRQGKLFMLTDSIKDISQNGMWTFFAENMNITGQYSAAFDYRLKRYLLTKKEGSASFTISYSPLTDSFISFHTYTPQFYIGLGQRLYTVHPSGLWEHHIGDFGKFYNITFPFEVTFPVNGYPAIEKVFSAFKISCKAYNGETYLPFENFSQLRVYNEEVDSGNVSINASNSRKVQSSFNVSVPRNTRSDFRGRMKGRYLNVKLSFSNNFKISLHTFITLINADIR